MLCSTRNTTCPVAMLERYMQVTCMPWEDQRFLFQPIQATKRGQTLRELGKISYSCLKEAFKKKMADLSEEFELHSLRAGGPTTAANAKVMDRCFKRHGRWKSKNAKDGYIKDNLRAGWESPAWDCILRCMHSLLSGPKQLHVLRANLLWWHNTMV